MASAPDLQKQVNSILDDLFNVVYKLEALHEQGLDDARYRCVEAFVAILNSTWSTMLDFFAQFPDLKPTDDMTDSELDAYLSGRGRVIPFPSPKTHATSAPDLRFNRTLDDLFKITRDLDAITKDLPGLDDARCRLAGGYREILSSTWASMIDLLTDAIFMTAEQEDAYWQGHGRIIGYKPKTDDTR
jgi:hypothetical protein